MQSLLNSFEALSLYLYDNSHNCEETRHTIQSSRNSAEVKDVHLSPVNRSELIHSGDEQVACLSIDGYERDPRWFYESASIIDYLIIH